MRNLVVRLSVCALLLSAGFGCSRGPKRDPVLAEAYIGPISVDIRDELAPNAKVVASAKHGEKVEIIGTRRRFIKVRLENGKEGWTDQRRLLTVEQMKQLEELAERAAKIPSMGRATVFDTLNMHSEPNRYSASFYQVTPGAGVQVLARRVTERTPPPPPEPIVRPPAPKPRARKAKPRAEPKVPPVPRPAPPKPPENWMELSRTDLPDDQEEKKPEAPPPAKRYDDWTLVRVENGRAGWVLSRMLIMSIPDEVAQYSEGARITSYFSLGEVDDPEAGKKRHWLWTTVSDAHPAYDFDSFRVFIWNLRRHRYETSYIERGVEGYYPVQVEGPKFTVLLKSAEGGFYTKSFVLEGYISRWLGNAPAQPPPDPLAGLAAPKAPGLPQQPPEPARTSMGDRLKGWIKRMTGRS